MAALCLVSFGEGVQYWMSWQSGQSGECTFKKYDMGDGEIEISKFWGCLYNTPFLGKPYEFTRLPVNATYSRKSKNEFKNIVLTVPLSQLEQTFSWKMFYHYINTHIKFLYLYGKVKKRDAWSL